MGSSLHLVDDDGNPLPGRIVEAVGALEPQITRKFSRCDPAELSNSQERQAQKIARREARNPVPSVQALHALTWRALLNGALSVLRKQNRRHEEPLPTEYLRNVTGLVTSKNPETDLIELENREAFLSDLTQREQLYLGLRGQGFGDEDIAAQLSLGKGALAQLKHRLKVKLVARGFLSK